MSIGNLFVISAPSGAGKTTLVRNLIESMNNIRVSISHTTRLPRSKEQNGVHYHFVNQDTFATMLAENAFLEHAQVFDYHYGTSKQWVTERLNKGTDIILEIDWQGAQQVKITYPESVGIFILPPSKAVLEKRLRKRGQDDELVITRRLREAVNEMSHYVEYDYLVINDDFQIALAHLQAIVHAQRLTQRVQIQRNYTLLADLLV